MENIKKEIYKAFFNVSHLTENFLRKYPQFQSANNFQSYPNYPYGNYAPTTNSEYPQQNSWANKYSQEKHISAGKSQFGELNKIKRQPNQNKFEKPIKHQIKKNVKDQKKYEKKLKSIQQQRQRQEQLKRKLAQQKLKNKKKYGTKLKDLIKRDVRYAQKPKFPLSPYFLFLREMRNNPPPHITQIGSHTQFAQQMGRVWRQMPEENKIPYITSYVRDKKIYDEETRKFYQRYPDLKPKGSSSSKQEKKLYSVNDPKYQSDQPTQFDQNQQPLENDILEQLPSEQQKQSGQMEGHRPVRKPERYHSSYNTKVSNEGNFNQQQDKQEEEWKDPKNLSEMITADNCANLVQID